MIAAAPPTPLATLAAKPTAKLTVAAAAGWTAWSDVKNGQYVLTLRAPTGEITTPAAVAPSPVPFRVALGKRSSGQIIAAYDTCPGQKLGPSCRISLLDVAAGTVKQVALAPRTTSNALPALSGDTLAFIALPSGKAGKTTADVMTVSLNGGKATTRWTVKINRSNGPLQVAVAGKAVALLSAQSDGAEQRIDAQTAPKGKVRKLTVAGSDFSCCESDTFAALSFTGASKVSVLDNHATDDGDADWTIYRLSTTSGKQVATGPKNAASGNDAIALDAVSFASDGTRDVVLAADATHPFGVYEFKPTR